MITHALATSTARQLEDELQVRRLSSRELLDAYLTRIDHLGPPMVEWWRDLGAPELTPELVSTLVDGVTEELGGREAEVLAARDRALRELVETKRRLGLAQATDGPAP